MDEEILETTESIPYRGDTGGIVYPETVSSLNTQPMTTFVELRIGSTKLTLLPPRYLISFEMNKVVEEASTFTLQLFDENWEELEYILSRNQTDVWIRYGFATGKQSVLYHVTVGTYSVEFTPSGTLLSLTGYTTGNHEDLQSITLDTGTLNPTEAAKTICKAAGWTVIDKNFEPSIDVESSTRDSWALIGDRPATYIINKLAPIAVNDQGRGGYRFYLDSSTSPPTAHFRPVIVSSDTIRTYVHMKGIDSPIIDLTLTIDNVWGGTPYGELITTELSSTFIDADTKEVHVAHETINSSRVDATGEYSSIRNDQYTSTVDAAGGTKSQMDAVLRYHLSPAKIYPYTGTLVIVGDPEIYPTFSDGSGSFWIRLIIVTDNGNLHYTSGLYMVESATDNIQDGIMTTSLGIVRDAALDGIESIEYKILHK